MYSCSSAELRSMKDNVEAIIIRNMIFEMDTVIDGPGTPSHKSINCLQHFNTPINY